MTILIDHIWVVGLVLMYVNPAIGRVRMRSLIAEGPKTASLRPCPDVSWGRP